MTTEQLHVESVDQAGKTYYHPITARILKHSQYNPAQYSIEGVDGYWDWQGKYDLELGQTYELSLTTKPKPPGPKTNPGAVYRDIRYAVAVESSEPARPQESQRESAVGASQEYTEEAKHQPAEPPKDPVQIRIERGMSFNAAYALLAAVAKPEDLPYITGEEQAGIGLSWQLRALRDRIYHEVVNVPVAPIGYCYTHETACQQGKSLKWGHKTDEGWCINGKLEDVEVAK